MNWALVPLPSPPASHEQGGAKACTGSAERAHGNMTVPSPRWSRALDGRTAHGGCKTLKNRSEHVSKVFRLEPTPALCFHRVTHAFNRTLVSVRT